MVPLSSAPYSPIATGAPRLRLPFFLWRTILRVWGGLGIQFLFYLKDGTVYNVTDYCLVDGQIHFTMLEEGGTKSVEHVIGFDELDLQKTIDVATQRGFRFVLRNEPLKQ
ncbi:MAG TPA: hypothetical protein VEH30_18410 [Terriglobales bacterium]|nr:hypothetical protein [Terriglobales bacterium]